MMGEENVQSGTMCGTCGERWCVGPVVDVCRMREIDHFPFQKAIGAPNPKPSLGERFR
jgi:hypothetical protein